MATADSVEIKAVTRSVGKGNSRTLRTSKMIPAVVYGPKTGNMAFSFTEIEAVKYSKHKYDNVIFTLKSDVKDLNNLKVLRKEFDIHPLSRRPIHFDFYAVDMSQTVVVSIELRFEGKPAGAQEGGLLNIASRDIEVECLPGNIPQFIAVDISGLGLDESIHASDLKLPPNVEMITEGTLTLATCSVVKDEPVAEAVAAPAEGAAPAAGATATPAPAAKKD